jgi:hypothetical protein
MNYQSSETIIKNALEANSSISASVELFPDAPEDKPLTSEFGDILIYFKSSGYSEPLGVSHQYMRQHEMAIIGVRVRGKNLRGDNSGVLTNLNLCKETLQGFDLTSYLDQGRDDGERLVRLIGATLINYDESEGIWEYELEVGLPVDENQSI